MTASERTVERVDRGEWGVAVALALAGIGLVVGSQVLVVAATVPLWYAAAAVFGTHQPTMVRLQRELAADGDDAVVVGDGGRTGLEVTGNGTSSGDEGRTVTADPGDTVTVRTAIQNDGSETITDLRVVDAVPEGLSVVSGSPRACVTLEPLETATLEYEVVVRRGEHAFGDATVRTRNATGTVTETRTVSVAGDDAVRCSPTVGDAPLGSATNDYAGEVPTDEGGSGVEFYSVRDYELGDPVGAIDWRRYAATRELSTVEYRAERATRVVCVVDARRSQLRAATTAEIPAVDLSADAAERTFDALVDEGHPTGVVGIAEERIEAVEPGTDPATREEVSRVLDEVWDLEHGSQYVQQPSGDDLAAELATTLPGEAQVYLFSSFVDDEPVDLVAGLRTRGYSVRVVSPDVTASADGAADDTATRLESLDRTRRLARARAQGARVVDWPLERPLGLVLRNAIGEVGRR
ncbi:DUF58 domain-containing protein [Halopiger xanaduensis]|uniref:Conserved repeat domain protein n=1 Tax=Halopiger xanaduensis (strain DSM 18323 / JCM 14033 / SH-6) TaxID=797210 RepID=F8D5U0_HALXS|nr:DUF58 domain-containing protein [Halopiger xanaduensis]AEH36520.1 conserved repeat domain protein [Halopiger xanaduensis SH-6]